MHQLVSEDICLLMEAIEITKEIYVKWGGKCGNVP